MSRLPIFLLTWYNLVMSMYLNPNSFTPFVNTCLLTKKQCFFFFRIKQFKKNRKKSRSDSRRFSNFRKDREALESTMAQLATENGNNHNEAAISDESDDSDADINISEMSSRYVISSFFFSSGDF